MNAEWDLVWRGFGVAVVGFVGVALYIVGLSTLYVGSYAGGLGCLAGAALFLVLFRRILSPYLDVLLARWPADESEGEG